MSASDDVLSRNASRTHSAPDDPLAASPSLRLAIVTCMDCRIDLYDAMGVKPGEAHAIRNAGGIVTDDGVRSLAISQRKLGTREVMLMHHTRCGMTSFSDDDFAAELERDAGRRPDWPAGAFQDTAQDVRESVESLRENPFLLAESTVRGFVHDVDTDELTEVT